MARDVRLRILGDEKDVLRAFKSTSRGAAKLESDLSKQTLAAGVGFKGLRKEALLFGSSFLAAGAGGAAVAAGLKSSIDAASNLNEQIAKSRQVFKGSSSDIEEWSRTTASSIFIARDEALAATGTFGNLFRTVGLAPDAAADMSRALVTLAADLASFNNASPEDALDAIRSGLVGEAEPLRRFGVLLSEARVQQEALAATGKTSVKDLTNQEKALARYRIILHDTVDAQGDAARTAEGFANQTRKLKAQLRDLSSTMGGLALPILSDYVGKLTEGIDEATKFGRVLGGLKFPKQFPGSETAPGDFFTRFAKGLPKDIGRQILGPSPKEIGKALADGLAPGAHAVERLQQLVKGLHAEVAKPFNFSAVDALTAGLNRIESAGLRAKDAIESRGPVRTPPPVVLTPQQRRSFFDTRVAREIDRTQDIKTLRGQVVALRAIAAEIQKKIDATKDITRRQNLEDDLLRVQRDISSREAQITENIAQARRDALDKQKELAQLEKERSQAARDRLRDVAQFAVDVARTTATLADDLKALQAQRTQLLRQLSVEKGNLDLQRDLLNVQSEIADVQKQQRNARQFKALGLSATGDERIPGLKSLRTQLGNVTDAVKGTFLDTEKTRSLLATIRKILAGGMGAISEDVRSKMRDMLRDLNQQLKGSLKGPLTKTTGLDTKKLLAGITGLTPEAERELRGRLSGFNSAGVALAGAGAPAGGARGGGGGVVEVTNWISVDGGPFERAVTRRQQVRRRRNPAQRRGPNAGQGL